MDWEDWALMLGSVVFVAAIVAFTLIEYSARGWL